MTRCTTPEALEQHKACGNTLDVSSEAPLRNLTLSSLLPTSTRWDLVRIGAALVVLGTLLLTGLSGNVRASLRPLGIAAAQGGPRHHPLARVSLSLELRSSVDLARLRGYLLGGFVSRPRALDVVSPPSRHGFFMSQPFRRNLISFNGETGILAFVLLGLALAPAPQRLSVDHLVLRRALPSRGEVWPARFIQLNVCLMYLFTTVAKLLGSWDLGRGEIWYEITLSNWFRFSAWEWLRTPLVCWLAVHGSLLLEGSFAFLRGHGFGSPSFSR